MIRIGFFALLMTLALPAQACRLALALAVDVSGSIDPNEYRFQMEGLADALDDPVIAEALVFSQAALMVVQWSGAGEQEISIPWQRMLSLQSVNRFSIQVRNTERRWSTSKTAVGDALAAIRAEFPKVADCQRKVIDVSGDGMTNDGTDTAYQRSVTGQSGITINGLAIDRVGRAVTEFFRKHVITGRDGFVITSKGYSDYPRAIEQKLFREIIQPAS